MKVNFKRIKELREKINNLIEEHPQLKELQDEIDTRLSKCNNQHNRAVVLQEMMLNTWNRIVSEWKNDFKKEPTKISLSIIENRCENCEEIVEEDLQEVSHTEVRLNYFVCEKCCESQFFRIVL